ncbi:MAG TPA: hypothetical protein VE862_11385 [Candidatus Acidoferrum sp.]|nr:hypothetical protein [Candidatus Acidoferrum sp.]
MPHGSGKKMTGLTSKEHLFLRVISVVVVMNAAVFYAISRNLQTFDSDVFQAAAWITAITVSVLTVHLLFWWRYERRTDNLRFWTVLRSLRKHDT